jgi:hypothetical protein
LGLLPEFICGWARVRVRMGGSAAGLGYRGWEVRAGMVEGWSGG